MREIDNNEQISKISDFSRDNALTLTDISDMLEQDMLRYSRSLDAEEEYQ